MNTAALTAKAFERRYAGARDPWAFASDVYELGRYSVLMKVLQRSRYGTVYEPGCSIGVLTAQLARISDRVTACDFAPSAVEQARRRCEGSPHVQIYCSDVRQFALSSPLDLVVFSEIGYYFERQALSSWIAELVDALLPEGEFLAAHWLGRSDDHVLHGDEVHEVIAGQPRLRPLRSARHPGFRLDTWIKS